MKDSEVRGFESHPSSPPMEADHGRSEGAARASAGTIAACAHASDCATNNAPALPVGSCDCGAEAEECRYCREDAVGVDRLGNRACEAHIEEADDYA